MRSRLALAILGIVLLDLAPVYALAAAPDVTGTVYEQSATKLAEAGILQGFPDGTVRPYEPISRAQAIKTIVLALPDTAADLAWYQAHPSPIPLFADMQPGAWYTPYIEVAFKRRMINGYSDSLLRPDLAISADESIAMIIRGFNVKPTAAAMLTSPYIENQPGAWYTPYINIAISKNIVMHTAYVQLGQQINRGQFFDMLYRMREVAAHQMVAYSGAEPLVNPQYAMLAPEATTSGATNPAVAPKVMSPDDLQYLSKKPFAISIPKLGISDITISTPADPKSAKGVLVPLATGLGHLFASPGQAGKILIYGHSSGYPWDTSPYTKIFRTINKLKAGDKVYVTYAGQLHVYEITTHKTVSAKDTTPYKPDGKGEQLILYTCWPPDSVTQRFLQYAKPI